MSGTDFGIELRRAEEVVDALFRLIAAHVKRLVPVGSVARKHAFVHDLDVLCEPGQIDDIAYIKDLVCQVGNWVKGGQRWMQFRDVFGEPGLQLDLFLCHPPAEWGALLAARISPAELVIYGKAELYRNGYVHEHGRLVDAQTGETVPTPNESDWFRLAGIPYVEPEERDGLARNLGLEVDGAA